MGTPLCPIHGRTLKVELRNSGVPHVWSCEECLSMGVIREVQESLATIKRKNPKCEAHGTELTPVACVVERFPHTWTCEQCRDETGAVSGH